LEKEITILIMPRANLKGIIDVIPIIKAHIEGLPDKINIRIPRNIIEKSQDDFLILRIFFKIEQHFKIFLEICYDIYIISDNDLAIVNNKYIETWKKHATLIPPDRRKKVETELYEWLLNEGRPSIMSEENLKFFVKYFKMSINNLDWSRKKKIWNELKKRETFGHLSNENKDKLIKNYFKVWKKYQDKITLPQDISPHIRARLEYKKTNRERTKLVSRIEFQKMKFCPMCGAEGGFNYCSNCGYDLRMERKFCKNCGTEIDRKSVLYCPNCGQKL